MFVPRPLTLKLPIVESLSKIWPFMQTCIMGYPFDFIEKVIPTVDVSDGNCEEFHPFPFGQLPSAATFPEGKSKAINVTRTRIFLISPPSNSLVKFFASKSDFVHL